MAKVMTVLRSLFLVFIVGFTVRALPFFASVPRTLDEQYSRCASSLDVAQRAAWYAVAWIALETAVGWFLWVRRREPPKAAAPPQA